MELKGIRRVYFIGIGGIGMSALARYFLVSGKTVAGYDRCESELTDHLISEGAEIHFRDDVVLIPEQFKDLNERKYSLIVYTPAIPTSHSGLNYFLSHDYNVLKRSELLGLISQDKITVAVAGTHGKTTISTMLAFIISQSMQGCNAILGGISKNFKSNLLVNFNSEILVTEADEFDRSFLKLYPKYAVISSIDADHLDVYGSIEKIELAFHQFATQVKPNGFLVLKKGVKLRNSVEVKAKIFSYAVDERADFFARNICLKEGYYVFDFVYPGGEITGIKLGQPGKYNIENAIAALSIAWLMGMEKDLLAGSLAEFRGIHRRFDIQLWSEKIIYIDDYAHHPREITACISSVRHMFPGKSITGIFQPHLYSRTRDLAIDFARSLDQVDRLILLDIYPARELPAEGVTSALIFDKVALKNKVLCSLPDLMNLLKGENPEVLLSMGAGNIDMYVDKIKKLFT
jgi:UDP-N-acetylmuramate--alanine ligase